LKLGLQLLDPVLRRVGAGSLAIGAGPFLFNPHASTISPNWLGIRSAIRNV
jgi:hypothetical protein